jgi:hypothetical protein
MANGLSLAQTRGGLWKKRGHHFDTERAERRPGGDTNKQDDAFSHEMYRSK